MIKEAIHRVVAIDPGQTGAAAMEDRHPGGRIELIDIYRFTMRKVQAGNILDMRPFAQWLNESEAHAVIIERAQAMPDQNASAMFNYGRVFGAIETVVLLSDIERVEWISPAKWKRGVKIGANKKEALNTAELRFGQDAAKKWWPNVHRSGAAEAALIALYWLEQRNF